jgi:hypothetical protein
MQTFLPYADFYESAKVLDRQRLGKQRVEVLQILRCLRGIKTGWQNHPAVKMWKGYENCLALYGIRICTHWKSRGYKDTCLEKIVDLTTHAPVIEQPPWMGREDLHSSHRATLLYKNPVWYGQWGWKEEPLFPDESGQLRYVWPV